VIARHISLLFDGFAYGMLLFVLSVGLSVTLGMMNFVNLAHGTFAMIGGYTTVMLMRSAGWPFFATLPVAFVGAAAASVVLERVLYRRLYRASDLDQSLLTIGIVFVSIAAAAYVFGTGQQPVQMPNYLRGRIEFGDFSFGIYRMFLVAAALVITGLLVLGLDYTRFGSRVRACVDNQRMARGLGLNVDAVFSITFALGSGLAGLGGALGIEIVGLDPNFAFKYLVYMLIVVAVGGLASIRGAFVTAAMLGIIDIVSKYYVPEIGAFVLYFVMVSFLVWRPAGLFVRRS
jgi:branched-chain amino acid transport system permease protein